MSVVVDQMCHLGTVLLASILVDMHRVSRLVSRLLVTYWFRKSV